MERRGAAALPHERPRHPDDRDFRTEFQKEYTEKHVDRCPASLLPSAPHPAAAPGAWTSGHVLYDRKTGRWADQ